MSSFLALTTRSVPSFFAKSNFHSSMSTPITLNKIKDLPHDKINKMACAPSEDSDKPGHPPGLIRQRLRCPHEETLGL